HVLVIGPRGMGKTMLVLRAVAEVRRDESLQSKWYPLVFAEESYEVTTPGEFWLEALFHLWHQTKDDRWGRTYEDLRRESDETRLRERALGQVLDFADSVGKRILLVVENLNMMLGDQISQDDAWVLRHTLQHEPRVMMLASATARFDEVENAGKAMFEMFRPLRLEPLTEDECRKVWVSFTGLEPGQNQIRPIQILTGGSPRLLAIISTFAAGRSFNDLMEDLTQLVDDHTEYFKTHLDNLAATERKVYLALAEIWDPATARTIAEAARLNVNATSSLLKRLISRGAVVEINSEQRTKWYQVAERLYNIYYLMRRRGSPSSRVRAVVNFMINFYGEEELVGIARGIAEEALNANALPHENHYVALEHIVCSSSPYLREKILREIPRSLLESPEAPPSLRALAAESSGRQAAQFKSHTAGERITRPPEEEKVAGAGGGIGRGADAVKTFEGPVELPPEDAWEWVILGVFLQNELKRYAEAEEAYRKAVDLEPGIASVWLLLGQLLHRDLKRFTESEEAYRKVIELKPENAIELDWSQVRAREELTALLIEQDERRNEGVRLAEQCVEDHPQDVRLLNGLARSFYWARSKVDLGRAEVWARGAVRLSPDNGSYQHTHACILCSMNKGEEALAPAEKYFGDAALVSKNIDEAIELGVQLAVAGVAWEAVKMIEESPSAEYLEPLIVGLRVYLGEEVKAAAEILEVGKDVAKRISERKKNESEIKVPSERGAE
ncbi:MAG: hypothetical protein NTZ09_09475, partial [Candidatus Hydrogenedentes bacterium]|nr:hypothetical protein [Candidatus Hydrogenedentota bacterium]